MINIFRKKQKPVCNPVNEINQEDKFLIKKEHKSNAPHILVYGIERFNLRYNEKSIIDTNFILEFEEFRTNKKFQDYDGVILFQSTFENIETRRGGYASPDYLEVTYDRDELVKRRNQLSQLLDKGKFVCFLIHRSFIDSTRYQEDASDTDLCKISTILKRHSLEGDFQINKVYRSEFGQFLKDYGIARVEFLLYSDLEPHVRRICETYRNRLTGFILLNNRYFIPCFLPDENAVEDFFKKLASALIATSKKLFQEIPSWVDDYKFKTEEGILEEETELQKRIEEFQKKKDIYKKYKRCLCYDGELLVESIENILKEGFGLNLDDRQDDKIEDRVILDADKKEIALLEIKGTNDNIQNIHISQADMHRSRREKVANFPTILIVNTFIKSSNSIVDKTKDVNQVQIKLAFDRAILMMKTIDLLNLLYLKEQGKIEQKDIIDIFTKQYGCLVVSKEGYEVKAE